MLASLPLQNITPYHLQYLQQAAKGYAWANSLFFKQPAPNDPTLVPFSLFPSPFPRDQFEKAASIQNSYNRLYCNMASNPELIRQVLGNSVSKVDPFIGRLYELWEKFEDQASKEAARSSLGIFRSDYLLHQPTPSTRPEIKQIEFNTISVGFAALATKVSDLHRYITGLTPVFYRSQIPMIHNDSLQCISKALRMAHQHYLYTENPIRQAVILIIAKPDEKNVFDQTLIEYELSLQHDYVKMIRLSCHEILQFTSLDPITKKLFYQDEQNHQKQVEVSVVYYRSMYDPNDFINEDDWMGRYQLESSRAINCPNFAMQLVGCKTFQQVLTEPKFLEIHRQVLTEGIEESQWNKILSTWTSIYPLDQPEAFQMASDPSQAIDFVLKPQREGGGHNIYGHEIPEFVKSLTENERKAYILMRLIKPPKQVMNYIIKSSPQDNDANTKLEPSEVVSELGIFGACLLQKNHSGSPDLLFNLQAGHLLRTKKPDDNEGGLVVGIACLDSPLLV